MIFWSVMKVAEIVVLITYVFVIIDVAGAASDLNVLVTWPTEVAGLFWFFWDVFHALRVKSLVIMAQF